MERAPLESEGGVTLCLGPSHLGWKPPYLVTPQAQLGPSQPQEEGAAAQLEEGGLSGGGRQL